VISRFRGVTDKVISMRWVGNDYSNEVLSVYQFNRARNWDEFREACSHFTSVAQNIVYADVEGNIGLQVSAGVPIREGIGILIYPGDTTQYDWQGNVPFEELPYSYNPENGMVSSANNRTADSDYPYYISVWYDLPNRIERIREMLTAKEKLTVADFMAMQADCQSVFARKFNPVFVEALENESWEGAEQVAFELLKNWDNELTLESPAALIFEQLYKEWMKAVFHDELGEDLYVALIKQDLLPSYLLDEARTTRTSAWFDDVTTSDRTEDMNENIQTAFRNTVAKFTAELGSLPAQWEWGDLHTLTLKHPMGGNNMVARLFGVNRGPFPVKGSFHTVGPYSYPMNDEFNVNHGASHRHIYTTENWDASQTVIPTGTSGIPASDHYCDQTELYLRNEYHPDLFTLEAVKQGSIYTSVFQ
ncbi:MAG: penicillin acylase family protein, partial [Prolixibacteraceae bacterium]|nr:penicillin acylase family protein [Prolixibacteraceae bacterium]